MNNFKSKKNNGIRIHEIYHIKSFPNFICLQNFKSYMMNLINRFLTISSTQMKSFLSILNKLIIINLKLRI